MRKNKYQRKHAFIKVSFDIYFFLFGSFGCFFIFGWLADLEQYWLADFCQEIDKTLLL